MSALLCDGFFHLQRKCKATGIYLYCCFRVGNPDGVWNSNQRKAMQLHFHKAIKLQVRLELTTKESYRIVEVVPKEYDESLGGI